MNLYKGEARFLKIYKGGEKKRLGTIVIGKWCIVKHILGFNFKLDDERGKNHVGQSFDKLPFCQILCTDLYRFVYLSFGRQIEHYRSATGTFVVYARKSRDRWEDFVHLN